MVEQLQSPRVPIASAPRRKAETAAEDDSLNMLARPQLGRNTSRSLRREVGHVTHIKCSRSRQRKCKDGTNYLTVTWSCYPSTGSRLLGEKPHRSRMSAPPSIAGSSLAHAAYMLQALRNCMVTQGSKVT